LPRLEEVFCYLLTSCTDGNAARIAGKEALALGIGQTERMLVCGPLTIRQLELGWPPTNGSEARLLRVALMAVFVSLVGRRGLGNTAHLCKRNEIARLHQMM